MAGTTQVSLEARDTYHILKSLDFLNILLALTSWAWSRLISSWDTHKKYSQLI
jgi:hypothetical protein